MPNFIRDVAHAIDLDGRAEMEIEQIHRWHYARGYRVGFGDGMKKEARSWFWSSVLCLVVGAALGIYLAIAFSEGLKTEVLLRTLEGR